jgi:ubiquinone/menaquinone biosynthesis C-methylase UbiE
VGSVLEHQCGSGKFATQLADSLSAGSYTGIDSLSSAIEYANTVHAGMTALPVKFMVASPSSESIPRQSYDTVVSMLAIHFPSAGEPLITRLLQLLKPGGTLIIAALSDEAVGGLGTVQNYFLSQQGEAALRGSYISSLDVQNYKSLNMAVQDFTEPSLLHFMTQVCVCTGLSFLVD